MHMIETDIPFKERINMNAEKMLTTILEFTSKISQEHRLDNLVILIAEMDRQLVSADCCTVWFLNEEKDRVWSVVAQGTGRIEMESSEGLVGHVIQRQKELIIKDAYKDVRFNPKIDQQTGYRTVSVLCLPIFNREGEIIGAYQAINKLESQSFTQNDVNYLQLAAAHTQNFIESAKLRNELLKTQKEMIHIIGEIGENRSKETSNHVKRVAKYSYLLARLYGLDKEESKLIEAASTMHDIGKVAIPDSILFKKGKLTVDEYTIMKTHAEIGFTILNRSERRMLKTAAIIAHQHHKRWDGQGYPAGLNKNEIHLYGRISALADVFDALSSNRIYKKAWTLDKVIDLIQEEKGKQFDPFLVKLFLENLESFIAIQEKYQDPPEAGVQGRDDTFDDERERIQI